jgi:hypothetical protein
MADVEMAEGSDALGLAVLHEINPYFVAGKGLCVLDPEDEDDSQRWMRSGK